MSNCQLLLSCKDTAEAGTIAAVLLEKHLVVCAKQLPVSSDYWWKSVIEHSEEILLIMTSREDLFDEVEMEVAKLHSYETYDLQAITLSKVSPKAAQWMHDNLKQKI